MVVNKRTKTVVLLVSIILFSLQSKTQGFLRAEGKKIVNEKGQNVLLRGMGLGGWMLQEGYMLRVNEEGQQNKIRARIKDLIGETKTAEFYDAWLANHTRRIDVDSMRAWGFNSIRLPMHYNLYTLPIEKEPVAGQNTWLERGFQLTDSLLAWCKANRMYLILDLHAAPGGQGNDLNISDGDTSKPSLWKSEANQQKTIALWKELARRYASEPWIGGYDIINEPNWGFEDLANDKNGLKEKKNEPLKKLMMDITKAIREVDQNHIIIIEGNGWGNNYNGILPPWDKNIVLSFHKYWNYNNQASIQHILDTREKYNVPVWLGETGENSNVWFTDAIRLLENNNIGWAWWPLKKLGSNNPLQIRPNSNYEQVINYWSGKGSRPDENTAYIGLKDLAASAKLENTIIHRDVIDAMFRQPFSIEPMPFKKITIEKETSLNAVDYDLGRNGSAYFDNDTADYHVSGGGRGGNRGRVYRNDGVDIAKDSADSSSYFVSNAEAGEWLQYTTYVTKKGSYTLRLTVASDKADGKLSIASNNKVLTKEVVIPNTSGLNNWKAIEINNISLATGKNVFRFYVDAGGFNLKSIQFIRDK
jgi:hypothetical protein